MQVFCVKSPLGWLIAARVVGSDYPKVCDTLTVKEQRQSKCCNGSHDVYDFEEYPLLRDFYARCFAILPGVDIDDIEAAEQEAIVPAPMQIESDPLSIEEKAIAVYNQVYEVTGCEQRAARAFFEILNTRS